MVWNLTYIDKAIDQASQRDSYTAKRAKCQEVSIYLRAIVSEDKTVCYHNVDIGSISWT